MFIIAGIRVITDRVNQKGQSTIDDQTQTITIDTQTMERFLGDMANEKPIWFLPQQLENFTGKYSRKLGSGGFGIVYKGKYLNGVELAVKQKQVSSNHVLSTQQCRKGKVDVAILDSDGTDIDQSVEKNGMGLTISNPGISNTINRDISQACLIMNTTLLAMGNPINTNAILESDHSATTINSSAVLSANTADSCGTSIDQFVEQNGMGLTISNLGISNTINKDIAQACLIMNTALLAIGNPIDTNAILESDQSATTVNPSAIVSANTTGNQ
ncbi:hypothetical protein GIB67_030165 [Kingdonia uniflora]|uniref:Uncharacterized protein n=1 Tax=Kingdonia uniflora TaxID=39325 RepID=A0A7J7LEL2_9MAGN|nr:hypothetical protein GIB67_030165 [Kingdonia uniflora]